MGRMFFGRKSINLKELTWICSLGFMRTALTKKIVHIETPHVANSTSKWSLTENQLAETRTKAWLLRSNVRCFFLFMACRWGIIRGIISPSNTNKFPQYVGIIMYYDTWIANDLLGYFGGWCFHACLFGVDKVPISYKFDELFTRS